MIFWQGWAKCKLIYFVGDRVMKTYLFVLCFLVMLWGFGCARRNANRIPIVRPGDDTQNCKLDEIEKGRYERVHRRW